jgi:hypothetical protein
VQDSIAEALDENKLCLLYSMDLSAAFDLVRPGTFARKALTLVKEENKGLVWLIHDFITERKAYVEVGGSTSMSFDLHVGCPQGSTLGPKVFSVYCADLIASIKLGTLVSYADDSYVVIKSDNVEDISRRANEQVAHHLDWLKNNGMVCNESKTEAVLFGSDEKLRINVGHNTVETRSEMKVLGVTFDNRLDWTQHVNATIKRTNRIMHGLKGVRKYVDIQQAKQIVTAFYYSVLYYGCEVWMHKHLSFHLKQKVRSAHYKALRLIHGQEKTRCELDAISQRSTPDEWGDYSIAKMIAMIVQTAKPKRLLQGILMNSFYERRQEGRMFFYDDSLRKIGRQRLKNRLSVISKQMKFKWLSVPIGSLRPNLKKCFFQYAKLTVANDI